MHKTYNHFVLIYTIAHNISMLSYMAVIIESMPVIKT